MMLKNLNVTRPCLENRSFRVLKMCLGFKVVEISASKIAYDAEKFFSQSVFNMKAIKFEFYS